MTRTIRIALIGLFTVVAAMCWSQTPQSEDRTNPTSDHRSQMSTESIEASKQEGAIRRKAEALLSAGNYNAAEATAKQGLLHPLASSGMQAIYGEALLRQHKNFEALQAFRQVNGSERDKRSYAKIGLLLLRLGNYEASRDMYSYDLLRDYYGAHADYLAPLIPAHHDARTLESAWLFVIGQLEDMYANNDGITYYYTRALKFNPKNPKLNFILGKMYLRDGYYEKAMATYKIVIDHAKGMLVDIAWQDYEQAETLLKEQKEKS